jgi:hypothetical protein
MASYPTISFANNEVSPTFNINTFQPKTVQSDNVTTTALTVLGPSNLNTLTANTITNNSSLTSNTITSTNLLTCNNGLNVSAGTVSFVAGAIPISSVNGCNSRKTTCENNIVKLQNATSGIATVPTISANTLH